MDKILDSGLLLIDKPPNMTSFDCVRKVRKFCSKNLKVGHGGTLDPFSTGLLIILIGKATRLAPFIQGMDKVYEGILKFGYSTDTYDVDGNILEEGPLPDFSKVNLNEIASSFLGPQKQIPPQFSAKRINKKRAYEYARRGEKVELSPVNINIYEFKLEYVAEDRLKFFLRCSSGTYVRALARDIGYKLGSPCHCLALLRKAVGSYDIQKANSLNDLLNPKGFIPFDEIELLMPEKALDFRDEKLFLNGQDILLKRNDIMAPFVKLVSASKRFLGVGKVIGRIVHPVVVFPAKD